MFISFKYPQLVLPKLVNKRSKYFRSIHLALNFHACLQICLPSFFNDNPKCLVQVINVKRLNRIILKRVKPSKMIRGDRCFAQWLTNLTWIFSYYNYITTLIKRRIITFVELNFLNYNSKCLLSDSPMLNLKNIAHSKITKNNYKFTWITETLLGWVLTIRW